MHVALKTFAIVSLCLCATACKREPAADTSPLPETAPAASSAPPAAPAQPVATDTTMAEAGVQPNDNAPPWYDAKTFPGTFEAKGIRIELMPDGAYRALVHAASADADIDSDGTWTLEPDGQHILLDSNDKSEADRRLALMSVDALRADDRDQTLQRVATR